MDNFKRYMSSQRQSKITLSNAYVWEDCVVATTEAYEAVASSVIVQIMGIPLQKLLVRVIFVTFGHFASSDFKVWQAITSIIN